MLPRVIQQQCINKSKLPQLPRLSQETPYPAWNKGLEVLDTERILTESRASYRNSWTIIGLLLLCHQNSRDVLPEAQCFFLSLLQLWLMMMEKGLKRLRAKTRYA